MSDLLGIRSLIWADHNETSGIYYFLPAAYYVRWEPIERRYALSLRYDTASGESEPKVQVRAVLEPRVTPAQRRAAEILVRQRALAHGRPYFELREMPIVGDATQNTAMEALGVYQGVESVSVRAPDMVTGEVEISWLMDALTVETFVEDIRSDIVTAPELILQSRAPEPASQRVPLLLSWEEPETYPIIPWRNGSVWRNELPHPVQLKGLHALVVDTAETLQMLSWDLASTPAISPGSRAAMGDLLPSNVSSLAFLTWVDYSIVPDEASIEAAHRSIMAGVSEQVRQPLRITLLDPLAATGAARIRVYIRSPYLQPGGSDGPLGVYDFEGDGETRSIPFYFGRAAVEVPFDWTATVIMPDGEAYEGGKFLPGDRSLELLVSSSSLRKIFEGAPWEVSEP